MVFEGDGGFRCMQSRGKLVIEMVVDFYILRLTECGEEGGTFIKCIRVWFWAMGGCLGLGEMEFGLVRIGFGLWGIKHTR